MSVHLTTLEAQFLDTEIARIYEGGLGGPELKQLARLFESDRLTTALTAAIQPKLHAGTARHQERVEVKVAWIDKRPMAKLAGEDKRGELGDAALFYMRVNSHPRGHNYLSARALILQAKAASEQRQMDVPSVPVHPSNPAQGSSTARELALMSRWEPFDLYENAANRAPIAQNIQINPRTLPPPHG